MAPKRNKKIENQNFLSIPSIRYVLFTISLLLGFYYTFCMFVLINKTFFCIGLAYICYPDSWNKKEIWRRKQLRSLTKIVKKSWYLKKYIIYYVNYVSSMIYRKYKEYHQNSLKELK
jgi:hypothetical protein